MRRRVELSCDLGEATEPQHLAIEEAIWPLIDAANIACGGHVGDDDSMRKAVSCAVERAVAIGAHPSYPDRENFGRRSMTIDPDELRASLVAQIGNLARIAREAGSALDRVKPHGALYNDAFHDERLARMIVEAVVEAGGAVRIVGPPRSAVEVAAAEEGVGFIREAFADRRYRRDGSLVPRGDPSALLLDFDEAARQATMLAEEGVVESIEGERVPIAFDTLCIHADMERADMRLKAIRAALTAIAG